MSFTFSDFLIGFFLMNAMPHILFGLLRIRFFSAFGFSPQGNIAYGFLNIVLALTVFHIHYGIGTLINHGFMIGAGVILLIYLVSGRFFYNLFSRKYKEVSIMSDKKTDLNAPCPCGSGKKAGECCYGNQPCSCGSGKRAKECCYAPKK